MTDFTELDQDKPSVVTRGLGNPLICIPHDYFVAWLRQVANELGFADREMVAVQYTSHQGEPIFAVPKDLVVMLSNIPNSRPVTQD